MAAARHFPKLSPALREELSGVEASHSEFGLSYKPCVVTLQDDTKVDRVYVVESNAYIREWGVWPEDDAGKSSINLSTVIAIADSPTRLPAALANRLYAAGESGMGYCVFTLVLADGRKIPCLTGNAVDFPALSDGVTMQMVKDVLPHQGRDAFDRSGGPESPSYVWCLYED